jgi:hypothetical protein
VSKQSKSIGPETGEHYLISVASPFTDKNGVAIFDGLEPGEEYEVSIYEPGLPYREKKAIIKVNETIKLYFLFDLTDKTGILGKINYNKEKSPGYTSIFLTLVRNNSYHYVTELDITGKPEFHFPNLIPGTYSIHIFNRYKDENEQNRKRILIKVISGKTSVVNISF